MAMISAPSGVGPISVRSVRSRGLNSVTDFSRAALGLMLAITAA
jgi:hypothetical protein